MRIIKFKQNEKNKEFLLEKCFLEETSSIGRAKVFSALYLINLITLKLIGQTIIE